MKGEGGEGGLGENGHVGGGEIRTQITVVKEEEIFLPQPKWHEPVLQNMKANPEMDFYEQLCLLNTSALWPCCEGQEMASALVA